jgi:hypothetical protein
MTVPIMDMSKWAITEEQLLEEVFRLCAERGIKAVHIDRPYRSRKRHLQDLAGFPDLLLAGPCGIAFREIKKEGIAPLSSAQSGWKHSLLQSGQSWDIWTPSDLLSGRIARELDALCS